MKYKAFLRLDYFFISGSTSIGTKKGAFISKERHKRLREKLPQSAPPGYAIARLEWEQLEFHVAVRKVDR